MDTNYLAENTLRRRAPDLHQRYRSCFNQVDELLGRYRGNFPEYTDHSLLHSMEVTNLVNYLISSHMEVINDAELYTLLMAALLHDVGMGLRPDEVNRYRAKLDTAAHEAAHPNATTQDFIREFHHELGALFVMEHWQDCMIPGDRAAKAIAAVGRGHRKVDLNDCNEYPRALMITELNAEVNLPYLAAVIRLADELDVSASRNLMLQYAGFVPDSGRSVREFHKHRLIHSKFDGDRFVIDADTHDQTEYKELQALCGKIEETLEYCQQIALDCTGIALPLRIIENRVRFTGSDESLIVQLHHEGTGLICVLSGKLDTLSAPILEEVLANSIGASIRILKLDFKDVRYVSSAGLRVMLSAKKKMMQVNGELFAINVPQNIVDILHMTGFDTMIPIEAL